MLVSLFIRLIGDWLVGLKKDWFMFMLMPIEETVEDDRLIERLIEKVWKFDFKDSFIGQSVDAFTGSWYGASRETSFE